VLSPYEALKEAERRGLDLVEISPKAVPPVCKLMDFGKFKYELKKKAQGSKKTSTANVVKEVTLSPQTDVHDLNFKMKNSQRFLEEGHRVKIMVKFRGREMAHPEIGRKQMERIVEALKEHGIPESDPKMEGRMLMAVFIPASQVKAAAKLAKEQAPKAAAPKAANPLAAKKPSAAPAAATTRPGVIVEKTSTPSTRNKA
jgi:translation initiation factor IF-3